MKNIEKYEKQIVDQINEYGDSLECTIANVAGIREEKHCYDLVCKECHNKCIEWMCSEYNEPILSDEEKKIVKAMIDFAHKCGVYVVHVCKFQDELNGVYIHCKFKDKENDNTDFIESPWLPKNMFKRMEYDREYTLEELGL